VVQVFVNLISNGCQAMDSGVSIDRKLTVFAAVQGAMIKVNVQGIGILVENLQKKI
jgi:C4-dicarboxylate-specific signal transduction histidine kinase